MSFLSNLVAKAKEVVKESVEAVEQSRLADEIKNWKEIFVAKFGSPEPDDFKKGDEAFYHLLTLGQHGTIVEKMIEAPAMFCRAKIVSAFFLGKSTEMVDGSKEDRQYPKAKDANAAMAADAISPILMERLQVIMAKHPHGVSGKFWFTDPNHSEYCAGLSGGKEAQEAKGLMHSLINIVDGLGNTEAKKEISELFWMGFHKQLPGGVFYRVSGSISEVVAKRQAKQGGLVGNGKQVRRQDGEKTGKRPPAKTDNAQESHTSDGHDPMKALRPTPADERALAEYKAVSGNGHAANDALASQLANIVVPPAEQHAEPVAV